MNKNALRFIDKISGVMPYIGLAIVIALIFNARHSAQIMQQTLQDSVEKQESLRNILWTNLLAHRIVIFSTSGVLKKDPALIVKAKDLSKAVPDFLTINDQQTQEQKDLIKRITDIGQELDPSEATKSSTLPLRAGHPILVVADKVDDLGQALNQNESDEWYNLVEKNTTLINDLKKRQFYIYSTYALFIFFLIILGFVGRLRRAAEKSLRQSEKKQRVLAEASFEGLVIIRDQIIVEVNPAFVSMFATSEKDVIESPVRQFITSTIEGFDLDINSIAMSKVTISEGIGIRGDGRRFPIEVSIKDSTMGYEAIKIIAVRDLSQKKITENLRLEKEAAVRSNQAKSLFLANMSHELRTPMHGILSFSRFGLDKSKAPENAQLHDFFNEIFESGNRLMQLLNDLLDLAKLEAGKMSYAMQALDFIALCEQVVAELEAYSKEKTISIKIKKDKHEHIVAVMDETRISQVVRNILSNAIKFSDPNSTVLIEPTIEADNLVCRITNKGKEIPKDELSRIFDKFFQSSKTRTGAGGTGLGLSICKEIINHHHGQIFAESGPGGFAVFTFKIPLDQSTLKKNITTAS